MRARRPRLVDLTKLALENTNSPAEALAYETLYGKVSALYGGKPSRRDFQAALDFLEDNDGLVTEKDPSDRRRVRIWKRPPASATPAMPIDLANFFRNYPEYAPVYVTPSGAMRVRGIEEKDVTPLFTGMFRHTAPLVKAFREIVDGEKLGKKPNEAAVRKWWKYYDSIVDAIAKATAIEISEALKARRKIETKKIAELVVETLGKLAAETKQSS